MDIQEVELRSNDKHDYLNDLPLILTSVLLAFSETSNQDKPSTHKSYELTYVSEGKVDYKINGKTYHLREGSTIIVWPGVEHTYEILDESQLICVYFTLNNKVQQITKDNKKSNINAPYEMDLENNKIEYVESVDDIWADSMIARKDIEAVVIKGKGEKDLARIVENIRKENLSNEYAKGPMLQALALALIVQINRTLEQQVEEQLRIQEGSAEELVEIAAEYIEANFEQSPTIDEIAEYVYLSSGYFTRIFNRVKGMSPMNYLTECRINRAKELLEDTDMKINTISQELGFSSPQRFNVTFKKNVGIAPTEFRKDSLNSPKKKHS